MTKRGIIIANTGSPDAPTPAAVRLYLAEFLTDEHIMPMNPVVWKFLLHACILPARSKKSAAKYSLIWTEAGSPLTVTMGSLARKLEAALRAQNCDVMVRPAASYGTPSLEDALSVCVDAECDEFVVVPLYPQSAYSTTSVVEDRARAAGSALHAPSLRFIPPYYRNPLYTEALVRAIRAAGFGEQEDDRLLFAFHSIPRCDLDAGDTYDRQVEETVHAIVDELGLADDEWALGFQCRFDKRRTWLDPFVSDALAALETKGPIGRLFVVAPNFSIDCLETLYDIEIELRERFCGGTADNADTGGTVDTADADRANQTREFMYIPCLSDSDDQVALLCDEITTALNS